MQRPRFHFQLRRWLPLGFHPSILEQIAERFGAAPRDVEERIHAENAEELRAWSKKLLFASSLEDVFR